MKTSELAATIVVGIVVVAVLLFVWLRANDEQAVGESLRLCTITESVVAIGHQASTRLLTPGTRQWAIIQQPKNATNTVSISFTGPAVAGRGYELTPATSTNPIPELRYGFATDMPLTASSTAITDVGSTTVKVIECK